jgi:hypothetical protein
LIVVPFFQISAKSKTNVKTLLKNFISMFSQGKN